MIDVESYDRTHALSADELHHMRILVTRFQKGGKGWHKAARPALQRLLRPLEVVLDHLGAVNTIKRKNTIRTTVICLRTLLPGNSGPSFGYHVAFFSPAP